MAESVQRRCAQGSRDGAGTRAYWIEWDGDAPKMMTANIVSTKGTWTRLRDISTGREWNMQRVYFGRTPEAAVALEIEKRCGRPRLTCFTKDLNAEYRRLIDLCLLGIRPS